jgi:DNA-binding NarL/FixJ family response regulator
MTKIILADDHKMFREGIRFLLEKTGNFDVIAEASNGKELLEQLKTQKPGLILLDISMPEMGGIECAEIINELYPSIKMIALSMYNDIEYYHKMVQAGVNGFVLKDSGGNELLEAIEKVLKGESYFSQELMRRIIYNISNAPVIKEKKNDAELTKREVEILDCICRGLTNSEIADKLNVCLRTVEVHKSHIFEKTECKNSINLVIYAIKHKLINL